MILCFEKCFLLRSNCFMIVLIKKPGLAECHTFGHIALTDPHPKSTRVDEAETGIALVL